MPTSVIVPIAELASALKPLQRVVVLGMRHSDADLGGAGLLETFREGEAQANAPIEQAARTLAPLGVTEGVVRGWVEG